MKVKVKIKSWTIILVPKSCQLSWFDTESFQERRQQRFSAGENFTKGEEDFTQFMRLINQLVIAAENFRRVKNLSPVLTPTMSKDMHEQRELTHKVVDVVD